MDGEEITKTLCVHLEKQGYKCKVVSVERVTELQRELEDQYKRGLFDEEFYREELAFFDFKTAARLPEAKSLIIVAVFQPQVRITFTCEGKSFPCIIPPTYSHSTDEKAEDVLNAQLRPNGYYLHKATLPLKLLAVRSGLAQYGRNNIAYVQGMGSFPRLVAFYSNFPCLEDSWKESELLERCQNCSACMKACPTDAIPSDRFLLRGERCITFHNERQGDFPQWIDPSWHHCLVGCLNCQNVCPVDRDFRQRIEEGAKFSHVETAAILQGLPQHQTPHETIRKMEELDMMDYFDVLGRNLSALIDKEQKVSL